MKLLILSLSVFFCFNLVDYDFAQKHEDGLNFIIKNKIEKQSYLVTGRFIDQNIFQDLVNYNIQVIPKLYFDYLKKLSKTQISELFSTL